MFIIMKSGCITITTLFMASNGNAVLKFHATRFFPPSFLTAVISLAHCLTTQQSFKTPVRGAGVALLFKSLNVTHWVGPKQV